MEIKIIDTHAHINFNIYREDGDEVVRRSLSEGVGMILIGSENRTSKRALDYANRYENGVWAAVGLHPSHLFAPDEEDEAETGTKIEKFNYDFYAQLAAMPKTVAIGETGLDYRRLPEGNAEAIKSEQKEIFLKQLELALQTRLPVIIHCRDAHDDLYRLLVEFRRNNSERLRKNAPWGVVHCFSGTEEEAWKYFELNLAISFNGIITFAREWDDLIRKMPLERILVETDCPYLTPVPFRGRRNEPLFVRYVVEKIAALRGASSEKIAEITTKNARTVFGI